MSHPSQALQGVSNNHHLFASNIEGSYSGETTLDVSTQTPCSSMTLKRPASALCDSDGNSNGRPSHAKKRLRIRIPSPLDLESLLPQISPEDTLSVHSNGSSLDSLFDDADADEREDTTLASLTAPSDIDGLYFDASLLLSEALSANVVDFCRKTYFHSPGVNQVMLFGRFDTSKENDPTGSSTTGFPPILRSLLDTIGDVLRPSIPADTYDLLFPTEPTQSRQAIINLYHPGEGITPHVDLLGRYGDGIIGVSFGSGCVMRFDEVIPPSTAASPPCEAAARPLRHDLYLPERSLLVLSKDARYKWTHGIAHRTSDCVAAPPEGDGQWLERGTRLSVTFRWMLEGADVVGNA